MFSCNLFRGRVIIIAASLAVFTVFQVTNVLANKSEAYQNVTGQVWDEARKGATSQVDLLSMVASMKGDVDFSVSDYNSNYYREELNDKRELLNDNKFDWHLKLDHNNRYRLSWRVDYQENRIVFSLKINQTSSKFRRGHDIFALGFSQNGKLSSSDFCLLWYDLAHRIHLQDALTDSHEQLRLVDESLSQCEILRMPSRATKRSSTISRGTRRSRARDVSDDNHEPGDADDGELVEVIFERPLDVCSSDHNWPYYTIDNGTSHLVWFAIKGPLLSIDGLNLTRFKLNTTASELKHGQHLAPEAAEASSGSTEMANFEFGMRRVQLIASKRASSSTESSPGGGETTAVRKRRDSIHEVLMDKFEIPAEETTYWCKLFKLPGKFEYRRYHVTRYEAVVENEQVVHHMELFNCANLNVEQELKLSQLHEQVGGWSGNCNGPERPPATNPCRRVVLAWAMGAKPLEYPPEVGQSMGGRHYSRYVVLEVHYNNVARRAGLIDSSGLRFHYTSRLRPFDAGVLEVGLEYSDKNSIPPGLVAPLAGHCVAECTRVAMAAAAQAAAVAGSAPSSERSRAARRLAAGRKLTDQRQLEREEKEHLEEDAERKIASFNRPPHSNKRDEENEGGKGGGGGGIYIFAAQMHTHLTGVASWTEQVRGGKLLRELQRDNHYSPHFQEIRLLPEPVYVAPGDALIHYCLYDTRERSNITLGGFSTTDEMCVTYLHYYPRIDLEVCKSSVDDAALEQYFAYLANQEGQQTTIKTSTRKQLPLERQQSQGRNMLKDLAKSVRENYLSIEWSRRRSEELMQFYSNAPLSIQCNRSDGNRLPGFWTGLAQTKLWPAEQVGSQLPYSPTWGSRGGQLAVDYRGVGSRSRHAACTGQQQRQPVVVSGESAASDD